MSHVTQVKAGPFTHAFKKACEFETELDSKLLVTSSGLGVSDGFSATGVMRQCKYVTCHTRVHHMSHITCASRVTHIVCVTCHSGDEDSESDRIRRRHVQRNQVSFTPNIATLNP